MGAAEIEFDRKYGRLTPTVFFIIKRGERHYTCSCDCGGSAHVRRSELLRGVVKSCGCLSRELSVKRLKTHGLSDTPTYESHQNMIKRCYSPLARNYKDYGSRGIGVCDSWHNFEGFLADMGLCPTGLTLERKDSNLGYSKDNCVWASQKVQQNNRRNNTKITFNGETLNLTQWAERLGMNTKTLISRVTLRKWSIERALTQPVRGLA